MEPDHPVLLPYGYGSSFPAFLTHRAAVDVSVVDWMRPLFDKGVRPEGFSKMLLEQHTNNYTRVYTKKEHLLLRDGERVGGGGGAAVIYLAFGDKTKFAGLAPTGKTCSRFICLHFV